MAVHGVRNPSRSERARQDVYLSAGAVKHCRMARMLQQTTVDERPDLLGDEICLGMLVVGLEEPGSRASRVIGDQAGAIGQQIAQ